MAFDLKPTTDYSDVPKQPADSAAVNDEKQAARSQLFMRTPRCSFGSKLSFVPTANNIGIVECPLTFISRIVHTEKIYSTTENLCVNF